MIRKTLMIAALAAAVALPGASAFAATPQKTPAAPAASAPAQKAPSYDEIHKALVATLTQVREGMKNDPEFGGALQSLPGEVAKLEPLQKAFVDAKNAGNEDAAKQAAAAYAEQAQKIIGIIEPMDEAVQGVMQQLSLGIAQLGDTGKKLVAEKDVKAALADIETTLKPLSDANKAVSGLQAAAEKAAEVRVQAELERIQKEEFANAVNNYLNGQAAK